MIRIVSQRRDNSSLIPFRSTRDDYSPPPPPFKPIIASIKWKVSNNEGIIVARLVISILGSHSRCITADIVAFDGERWSSSVS